MNSLYINKIKSNFTQNLATYYMHIYIEYNI